MKFGEKKIHLHTGGADADATAALNIGQARSDEQALDIEVIGSSCVHIPRTKLLLSAATPI